MAAIIAQLTRNFAEGVEILNAPTLNSATATSAPALQQNQNNKWFQINDL